MTLDDSLRANHRALSELDLQYRERALRDEVFLERSSFAVLDEPNALFHYRLQSWPTFLDTARMGEIERLSVGIARLIREVPQRIFGADPARLAEFYDIDPDVAALLVSEPSGADTAITRGDLIHTADGFRCIEFNFTPSLGGWETGVLGRMHHDIEPTKRFLAESGEGVSYINTVAVMLTHVLDTVEERVEAADGPTLLALVASDDETVDPDGPGARMFNRELAALDHPRAGEARVTVARYRDFAVEREGVFLGGERVHALVELGDSFTPPEVYRAFKARRVWVFNGPLTAVLTNKRNLALLSEFADSGIYDDEERALIESVLPWTRQVTADFVTYQGEREYLPDLLVDNRQRFVIKDALEYGGKGVLLGRATTPEQWEERVEEAIAVGGWVAQEVLESLSYLYQCDSRGCAPHDVIWGPFVFGDRFGGVILRMQPNVHRGAVNLSLTATEGIVYEIAGDRP